MLSIVFVSRRTEDENSQLRLTGCVMYYIADSDKYISPYIRSYHFLFNAKGQQSRECTWRAALGLLCYPCMLFLWPRAIFYCYVAADGCRLAPLHAKQSFQLSFARLPPSGSLGPSLTTTGWQWMETRTRASGSAECENLACGLGHVKGELLQSNGWRESGTLTVPACTVGCSYLMLSRSKPALENQPAMSMFQNWSVDVYATLMTISIACRWSNI